MSWPTDYNTGDTPDLESWDVTKSQRPPRREPSTLTSLSYREEYLRSPEWRQTRRQKLNLSNYRCERCGTRGPREHLDVHHLTYERLGHENIDTDLQVLCRPCHASQHSA